MNQTALEILKLVVQALTPLVVGYLGWKLSKRLKDIEQTQWANRKLTEKRIQIYDEVSPLLNRLFCYFTYVGDWKNFSPEEIIETKRVLDSKMNINKYLLEPEVIVSYSEFTRQLFKHYNGMGTDAKLKTDYRSRMSSVSKPWREEWEKCFSTSSIADRLEVEAAYQKVMIAQRKGINA